MLCFLRGVVKHGVQKAMITNIPLCNPRLLVFFIQYKFTRNSFEYSTALRFLFSNAENKYQMSFFKQSGTEHH